MVNVQLTEFKQLKQRVELIEKIEYEKIKSLEERIKNLEEKILNLKSKIEELENNGTFGPQPAKLFSSLFKSDHKPNLPPVNIATGVTLEQNAIEEKSKNVIIFGLKESPKTEKLEKLDDDKATVDDIFKTLAIHPMKIARVQ